MSDTTQSTKEILQLVDLYIDKALSKEERLQLIDNIKHNPTYSKLYEQEKHFIDFVKQNFKRAPVSPDFKKAVKQDFYGS